MIKNNCLTAALVVSAALVSTSLAQLNGSFTPNLDAVEIPVFNGTTLSEQISSTSFEINMQQSLTSSTLGGSGNISNDDFYVDDTLTVAFEGELVFSARAALRGRVVTLAGAKATLRNVTGSGTLTDSGDSYDVTLTGVVGSFLIRNMQVNLDDQQVSGTIPAGSLRVAGYLTDEPSSKGTRTARFTSEPFGPFDFPGEIITPALSITLATNSKGVVGGGGNATFGDYDEVLIGVKGRRNAKTGVSTLTLKGEGAAKAVSATLNLDGEGELVSRPKSSLSVLGYRLQFP